MASTAPVSGRCRLPLPFTDCSPSRTGPLSRQQGVAACRQPQRTVTCSAHESGHQQSVSEILRRAAIGLAAAASVALPMSLLPDQVPRPPACPHLNLLISCVRPLARSSWPAQLARVQLLTASSAPLLQLMAPAQAGLVSREPVKNARSLLRNALPINDRYIREIQVLYFEPLTIVRRCHL